MSRFLKKFASPRRKSKEDTEQHPDSSISKTVQKREIHVKEVESPEGLKTVVSTTKTTTTISHADAVNGQVKDEGSNDDQTDTDFSKKDVGVAHAAYKFDKKTRKPLFGGWWGKKFGIRPSASVTSRRPKKVRGATRVQDYDEIKKECLDNGELWEDDQFPAQDDIIFHSRRLPKPFEWKRPSVKSLWDGELAQSPKEISSEPKFIAGGMSRFDVQQGELGDCWLLAAIANLTLHAEVLAKVVPSDQTFDKGSYAGVFRFQFWQYGHWVEVLVDDRLPTYNGKLAFMHSKDGHEFWSALLEKAYAKLHGSYEALKGGSTSEAMEDFTGGLAEMYDLKDPETRNKNIFNILKKALLRYSLMGCSIEADPNVLEARMTNGLIKGHAYSLTDVRTVSVTLPSGKTGNIQLMRIRNPWGNESEWLGAWSDRSPEWGCISPEERKKLGLVFEADGEFWMSYPDFLANFEKLEICNLGPEAFDAVSSVTDDKSHKHWEAQSFDGAWVKGATAGGCRNFLQTFAYNPQFRIELKDTDDDEDEVCTCIIALMQKHRRKQRVTKATANGPVADGAGEMLTMGYVIYKVEGNQGKDSPLDREFFRTHLSCARSNQFVNIREVCSRFKLEEGAYVIVPSTFDPNQEGEFLVRVFSEKECGMQGVQERTGYAPPPEVPISAREPGLDDKLSQIFAKIAGEDMEIDAFELQKVITGALKKEFSFDQFSIEACRSMIALVDISRSGKLDLEEFKELWEMIRVAKSKFKKHDVDNSGSINSFELAEALRAMGYRLHSRVQTALVLRYADSKGQVSFDAFIGSAIKLRSMIEMFRERDPDETGKAVFDLDAWVELTMYS